MNRLMKNTGQLIIYIVLILVTALCLLPLWWMITTALKTPTDVFAYPPTFWPSKIEWRNFLSAWEMAPWGRYFFNTVLYTLCTVVGVTITSVMSGYAFAKLKFKGRNLLFVSYIGTMLVPAQVTIIPVYMILSQLGWVDTYAGLIIPGIAGAFGCFLMRQFIATIPDELIESAIMDGANHWRILVSVITPLVKPAVATLGIFTFMGSWNNFFWPLVVTNSEKLRVLQVGLSSFQNQYGNADWGAMMAAASFVSIPIIIIFFFAQKYFIEGITMTGIKG